MGESFESRYSNVQCIADRYSRLARLLRYRWRYSVSLAVDNFTKKTVVIKLIKSISKAANIKKESRFISSLQCDYVVQYCAPIDYEDKKGVSAIN